MVWFFFSAVMTSIFLPGSWSVTVPTYVSTLPLTVPSPVSVFVSVFASSVLPTCFDSWVVFTSPWEVWVVDSDLRSTVPGSFEQAKAETRNAAPSALTRKEYLRSCMMFMPPNGLKAGTVPAVISGRHGRVRGGRSLPALGADRPAEKGEPVVEDELQEEARPRTMGLQGPVDLGDRPANRRKPVPRHGRKIVMLVVIAHVERHDVEQPIITRRLLAAFENEEVLLNPARPERSMPEDGGERGLRQDDSPPVSPIMRVIETFAGSRADGALRSRSDTA